MQDQSYIQMQASAPPSYEASQDDAYSAAKSPSAPPANDGAGSPALSPAPQKMQMVVNCPRCQKQIVFPADVMPRPGTLTTCDACGQQFQLGGAPAEQKMPIGMQQPMQQPMQMQPPMQQQPMMPMMPMGGMGMGGMPPMMPMPMGGMGMMGAMQIDMDQMAVQSDPLLQQIMGFLNNKEQTGATAFPVSQYSDPFQRARFMFTTLNGVCMYLAEETKIPYLRMTVKLPKGVRAPDLVINMNVFLSDVLIPQKDNSRPRNWHSLPPVLDTPDPVFMFRSQVSVDISEMQQFLQEVQMDLREKFPDVVSKGMFGRQVVNSQHTFKTDTEAPQVIVSERRTKCGACMGPFPDNIFKLFEKPWFLCLMPLWLPLMFALPFLAFPIMFGYIACYMPCQICCCPPPNPDTDAFSTPLKLTYPPGSINTLRVLYRQNGGGLLGLQALERAAAQAPPHRFKFTQ